MFNSNGILATRVVCVSVRTVWCGVAVKIGETGFILQIEKYNQHRIVANFQVQQRWNSTWASIQNWKNYNHFDEMTKFNCNFFEIDSFNTTSGYCLCFILPFPFSSSFSVKPSFVGSFRFHRERTETNAKRRSLLLSNLKPYY